MNSRELEQLRLKINKIDEQRDKLKKKRNKIQRNISRKLKELVDKCEECWDDKILQVHHIDKNPKNNSIDNLVKLCLYCHMKKHEWEPVYNLMKKLYNKLS